MQNLYKSRKERHAVSYITKQLVHSFEVNIKISQRSKVMFTEASTP